MEAAREMSWLGAAISTAVSTGLTVGVEEEFLFVDPASGRTTPCAPQVFDRSMPACPAGATVQRELRATQAEASTGICHGEAELRQHLVAGRQALAVAAGAEGVLLVPTGCPPLGTTATSTQGGQAARFTQIDEIYQGMVADYEACGCHVHVGVPDRESAVAIVNHLRPWLPVLLALSVNSPFVDGRDSGYGSWRIVQQSRFPGAGMTPWFASFADYAGEVGRLIECGVLVDERMTFWLARPSPALPTVELRVADTAATVDEAVLYALLARALVRTALAELARGREAGRVDPQVAAAAMWSAARYGLTGAAVDPVRGGLVPAQQRLAELLAHIRPALADTGDLGTVVRLLGWLWRDGTGAQRQRAAASAHGILAAVHQLSVQTARTA